MMKNYIILLLSLSGISICGNFFLLMGFNPEVHRWGRVLSTTILLALFLTQYNRKKALILGAIFLLLVGDVVALNYDSTGSQQAFFVFQSLAYLLLIFHTGRFLLNKRLKINQIIYFTIVSLINSFLLVLVGDIVAGEVSNPAVVTLFYAYGFSSIILISIGILYYDRFSNDLAASFLFAVIGLVFSNLMGFPAHFLDFWEFFFLDRFFYILGTAGLVAYAYHSNKTPSLSWEPTGDHL